MKLTIQVVKNIETPRLLVKAKNILMKYPSHILAVIMGVILVYTIYSVFMVKYFNSVPIIWQDQYIHIINVSAVAAISFIIISRNKLQSNVFVSLFLNTHIKAHQLLIGSYAYLYAFFLACMTLVFLPLFIIYLLNDNEISLFYFMSLFFLITFIFYLSLTAWMVLNVFIKKFSRKNSENFILNALSLITFVGVLLYVTETYFAKLFAENPLIYFVALIIGTIVIGVSSYKISTVFLMGIFREMNVQIPMSKKKGVKFQKNHFIMNLQLECLHFYRNQVFKEQLLVLILIIIFTIGAYYYVDKLTFAQIYSTLANFGLKEIFVMVPLLTGNYFKRFKNSIYLLNLEKYHYFLPRVLFIFLISFSAHALFILFTLVPTNQDIVNILNLNNLSSMALVIMVSMFFGFALSITESNRPIVLISIILFVVMLDFVINQYIQTPYLINLINLSIASFFFLLVEVLFLRKPILK